MKIKQTILFSLLIVFFSQFNLAQNLSSLNNPESSAEENLKNYSSDYNNIEDEEPIIVMWEDLIDINYETRFFKDLEMEVSAPIFGMKQKALDGKEIMITGFVIPFDENTEYLSLSANPYASCFFCGNASPASVISMYMKQGGKRYMIDDFKTFKGTLHLNYDDPNEFIYLLKNAEEVETK